MWVRAVRGDDGVTVVEMAGLGRSESAKVPEELGDLAGILYERAPGVAEPDPDGAPEPDGTPKPEGTPPEDPGTSSGPGTSDTSDTPDPTDPDPHAVPAEGAEQQ